MQLLRGQYEREKRLLDQKVRQIAELESTHQDAKVLAKENQELLRVNKELDKNLKLERERNEKS